MNGFEVITFALRDFIITLAEKDDKEDKKIPKILCPDVRAGGRKGNGT